MGDTRVIGYDSPARAGVFRLVATVCTVRRQRGVHTEHAGKLFERLRGARLDGTYEDEMSKLHRVELLIIGDLALHRLGNHRDHRDHRLL